MSGKSFAIRVLAKKLLYLQLWYTKLIEIYVVGFF
jgi:hypothetical protein